MELSVLDTLPFSIANHMLSIRSDSDNNELLLPTASNTFDSEKKSSDFIVASDISGFTYSLYDSGKGVCLTFSEHSISDFVMQPFQYGDLRPSGILFCQEKL